MAVDGKSCLLLLVSLMLTTCLVAGEPDLVVVDVEQAASAEAASVAPQTFGKHFFYKPFTPWWPTDTCSWDFSSTGIWQVWYTGTVDCSVTFGKNLASFAKTTLGGRSFRTYWSGAPTVTSVVCAKDTARKQVTYVVRMSGVPSRSMALLRSASGRALMQRVFTSTTTRAIRGASAGARFFKSEWISSYWCSGCPLTPDVTAPSIFDVENVTYDCATPVASGDVCSYTCPDVYEPVEDTEPVCVAKGWKFFWQQGTGGAPECVPAAGSCTTLPTVVPEIWSDVTTPAPAYTCTTPVANTTACSVTCPTGLVSAGPVCDNGEFGPPPACALPCTVDTDCETNGATYTACLDGVCAEPPAPPPAPAP